jgi:hypothetical protein
VCAHALDGGADLGLLMGRQVIEHDDVAPRAAWAPAPARRTRESLDYRSGHRTRPARQGR